MLKDRQYIQALLKQPELIQRIMSFNRKREEWLKQVMESAYFSNLVQELYGSKSSVGAGAGTYQDNDYSSDVKAVIDRIKALSHDVPASVSGFHYQLTDKSPQSQVLWDKLYASNPNLLLFRKNSSKFEIFEFPLERLCLMNADELAVLSLYLGASRFGNQLSKVVWRQQRELVLSQISDEVYRFSLNSGRFLIDQVDESRQLCLTQMLASQLKIEGLYTLASMVTLFADSVLQVYWLNMLAINKAQLLQSAQSYLSSKTQKLTDLEANSDLSKVSSSQAGVANEAQANEYSSTQDEIAGEAFGGVSRIEKLSGNVVADAHNMLDVGVFKPSYCEHPQRIASFCQRVLALKVDRKWMQYLS